MRQLERLPDWEENLARYIAGHRGAAHKWGELDCLLFVAGSIEAITGFDPAKIHRGEYSTELGATRYLKRLGYTNPQAYLDDHFPTVPLAQARRGDVILAEGSAGVCIGAVALLVGEENEKSGLIRAPFSEWQAAWKIG